MSRSLQVGMMSTESALPRLQQVSLVVSGIEICSDSEVKALTEKYGLAACIFPSKEIRKFLNKDSSKVSSLELQMNAWKYDFYGYQPSSLKISDITEYYKELNFNESGLTEDALPCIKWEELIARKISNLALSNCMKRKLTQLIRSLSLEIDKWNNDHSDILIRTSINFQRYFCWKSEGIIDRIRTAKSLLDSGPLSIRERFNLACHYWFIRDITSLWRYLSAADRYNINICSKNTIQQAWLEALRGTSNIRWSRLARLSMPGHLNLRSCFHLLSRTEKVRWLKTFIRFRIIEYADVYFCLSKVRPVDRQYVFGMFSSQVLEYFLEFPLQDDFLRVSSCMWPFMSPANYIHILNIIIYQRIIIGWEDFNYVQLLKEFWDQSPLNFKESIKEESIYQTVLSIIRSEGNDQSESERLLEDYKKEHLTFQCLGIKYFVYKKNPVKERVPPPESESVTRNLERVVSYRQLPVPSKAAAEWLPSYHSCTGACIQEDLISRLTRIAISEKVRQPSCVGSLWLSS
ncbi:uncharacterized protein TNCV_1549631 [Trichonephila clavipes]|nr:uncharacterized protein TNCV_1549631 [Trichonephila clavipes]